jgi:Dolichyl-phosphate-mannose-protein mannosyltransferase
MRRPLFLAAAILLFVLFALQLVLHATRASATIDEPGHLLAGYRHLACGDFAINPHHPPLLKVVAALPLLAMDVRDPLGPCSSTAGASTLVAFDAGHRFLLMNGVDRLMIPARLASMLFSLALAVLVFAAARAMFSDVPALIALAVLAFEPSIIAHGSLVTNDIALTTTLFATVFGLHRYREHPTTARLIAIGIAAGLTLSAKHSGIVVLPVLVLFLGKRIRATAIVIAIAVAVLIATYGFRWEPYAEGFRLVLAGGERVMYLFDRAYPSGRWFYFPVVFTIKASIAMLVLLPFAIASRRALLLVPPLLFLALSMSSGLNIGVRHILPIWPFVIVAGAGAMWTFARDKRAAQIVLAALLVFHALSAVATAPSYIAFANELWGGTAASHRIFKDSNVEWGQNLKLVREESAGPCWFASYGHGALSAASQRCRLLPAFGWSTGHVVEPIPEVLSGTVLLSATVLPPRGGPEYEPIVAHEPVALIGGSVLVYRGTFAVPHLSAISHATRALQLASLGRTDEAVHHARIGMQLAPNDVRTRRALAVATGTAAARPRARPRDRSSSPMLQAPR